MSKNKSKQKAKKKNKNKRNTAQKQAQSASVTLPEHMSAEEMQHIIAKAIVEAEEIKKKNKDEQKRKEINEWQEKIGYKEYSSRRKRFFNQLRLLRKLLIHPERFVIRDRVSLGIFKISIWLSFIFISIIFILFAAAIIVTPIYYCIEMPIIIKLIIYIVCFFVGISACIFSRLFYIASEEIGKVEDSNYIFGMFTSITSIVAIVIAIIAIVKGS